MVRQPLSGSTTSVNVCVRPRWSVFVPEPSGHRLWDEPSWLSVTRQPASSIRVTEVLPNSSVRLLLPSSQ